MVVVLTAAYFYAKISSVDSLKMPFPIVKILCAEIISLRYGQKFRQLFIDTDVRTLSEYVLLLVKW